MSYIVIVMIAILLGWGLSSLWRRHLAVREYQRKVSSLQTFEQGRDFIERWIQSEKARSGREPRYSPAFDRLYLRLVELASSPEELEWIRQKCFNGKIHSDSYAYKLFQQKRKATMLGMSGDHS